MNKKQAMARWHCIKTYIDKMGGTAELDIISCNQINVIVQTSQKLTDLIEWIFLEWSDVRASGQTLADGCKCVFVTFKPSKEFEEEEEEKD